jgi:hypothetical protein
MMPVYDTSNKVAEIRVSKLKLAVYGTLFAVLTMLVCILIAGFLGYDHDQSSTWDFPVALALFIPVLVIHEMLHASAALLYGLVKPKDISFRMAWAAMGAVCDIKVPVSVRSFRIIAITPFCVTVPFAFVVLLMYPSHVTAMFAAMTLVGCTADLIMLLKIRQFKHDLIVVDPPHSSLLGFDIHDIETSCS